MSNIRVQKWVALLSVAILSVKLLAYYLTHSVAVLSDALESIVNVLVGFFGWYSIVLSAKPRDADHPYGHGKIEFIAAGVEGILITLSALFIFIEAAGNLVTPVPLERLDTALVLLVATAVVNYFTGAVCIRTGTENGSPALLSSGKHLQTDMFTTVGVLAGLLLVRLTGQLWVDSAVAIVFGIIILRTGFRIVRSSVAGIMDERDKTLLTKMSRLLDARRNQNWVDIHNTRIIKYGSTLHLDCHLTVPWYLNVREAHAEIDVLARIVREEFGTGLELFVHADGCLPRSCAICIKTDCPVRQHPFARRVPWTMQNMQRDEKHRVET